MADSNRFNIPIPKGYRIYFSEFEVAGVKHRLDDVLDFFKSKKLDFDIEAEPDNKFDPNAIKFIGIRNGFFGKKYTHLGYLPKDVAKQIAGTDGKTFLAPRLKEVWFGDRGGLKIMIDLLGPKDRYKEIFPE